MATSASSFPRVGVLALCLVMVFSAVHVLRLNLHLVAKAPPSRTLPAISMSLRTSGPGANASGWGRPHPVHGMQRLSQNPSATAGGSRQASASAASSSSRQHAPTHASGSSPKSAPCTKGHVGGYPRASYVCVVDEDEIRARGCPNRRPFHSLLTVQDRDYMKWQTYAAYYHFVKQQKADDCTDMVAITRLLASPDGRPDDLMDLLPTHLTSQLGSDKTRGFQVINRPWSVLNFLQSPMYRERVKEEYVLILEGDHILLRPIPNLATPDMAVGFFFPYMSPDQMPNHPRVVAKWYKGPRADVQPTGPSPAILHVDTLKAISQEWYDLSVDLKADNEADSVFGWVLEMWGYTITCARHGVKHKVWQQFQIEPSATWHQNVTAENPYIYHYTFGLEYTRDGLPMVGQPGEWSFDKRKYYGAYPAYEMAPPPDCAHEAAHLLVALFNEAAASSPVWKDKGASRNADLTRKNLPPYPDASLPIYKAIVGTGPWEMVRPEYKGKAPNIFFFFEKGRAHTPIGSATWAPSADGTKARFDFCMHDSLQVETDISGIQVLKGEHYTFALKAPTGPRPPVDGGYDLDLAKQVTGTGPWAWGSVPVIVFMQGGRLHTPWAPGTWRVLNNETIQAEFVGANCHITFLPCGKFRSVRQSDGDVVEGALMIGEKALRRCGELR